MAGAMKHDELKDFRSQLMALRSRLRGDLEQMTDEALKRNQPEASGNLSNMPLHLADVGTENYDQEFTLSLIENEQTTLEAIEQALGRLESGRFGKCEECNAAIGKAQTSSDPLRAPLHRLRQKTGERAVTGAAAPIGRGQLRGRKP